MPLERMGTCTKSPLSSSAKYVVLLVLTSKAAFLLQIAFVAIYTIVTLVVGDENPLNMVVVKEQQLAAEPVGSVTLEMIRGLKASPMTIDDYAPLLVDELGSDANIHHDLTMRILVDNLHPQNGHVATDHQEEAGRNYDMSSLMDNPHLCALIVGSIRASLFSLFVNLLRGVRKLPKSMIYVLVVMALSWFSWLPFFLYNTDWMGRELYQGDPDGTINQVADYQRGVEKGASGLLNSVVSLISSLVIDFLYQMLGSKNVDSFKLHSICVTGVHGAHHTRCSWRPQVEPIYGGGIVCCAWFPICNHTLCPILDDDGAYAKLRWRATAS